MDNMNPVYPQQTALGGDIMISSYMKNKHNNIGVHAWIKFCSKFFIDSVKTISMENESKWLLG